VTVIIMVVGNARLGIMGPYIECIDWFVIKRTGLVISFIEGVAIVTNG